MSPRGAARDAQTYPIWALIESSLNYTTTTIRRTSAQFLAPKLREPSACKIALYKCGLTDCADLYNKNVDKEIRRQPFQIRGGDATLQAPMQRVVWHPSLPLSPFRIETGSAERLCSLSCSTALSIQVLVFAKRKPTNTQNATIRARMCVFQVATIRAQAKTAVNRTSRSKRLLS